jgi:MoxR-like ATPase
MAVTKATKKVRDIFPEMSGGLSPSMLDLNLWVYSHSDDDPHRVLVPKVDPHFAFHPATLEALILGETLGRHVYLKGDTGCGKTASVTQFCARRGKEMVRQNLDEHIARGELVGSYTAVADPTGKNLVFQFRRGSLALSILRPSTYLIDEFDTGSPAATVLLNPILESDSPALHIPETGEYIKPNREWRCVATGNTDGVNPDPRGIYSGTQTQNFASLNRFAYRVEVPYNEPEKEREIVLKKYPNLPKKVLDPIISFVREYRKAFDVSMELTVPFSTRMLHNLVEGTIFTGSVSRALGLVLLSVVPANEKNVVVQLAERCEIRAERAS